MEIKLIISFSCVNPTTNFQRLKILLVTFLFFIVEYIFLKQFVKLLMVTYTYLLTLDILLISETKTDESFASEQFLRDGFRRS